MANLSVLDLGDGVNRNIRDASSVHTLKINGVTQTVTDNEVDITIGFSVDFSTGNLIYTIGS